MGINTPKVGSPEIVCGCGADAFACLEQWKRGMVSYYVIQIFVKQYERVLWLTSTEVNMVRFEK
jgi:hypothetical protein